MRISRRARVLGVAILIASVSRFGDAAVCRRPKGQLVERDTCRATETSVDLKSSSGAWTVVDATGREIGSVAGISDGTVHALATMPLPDGAAPETVEVVLTPGGLVTVPYVNNVLSRAATCAEPLFVLVDGDRFATQLFPIRDSLGVRSTGRVLYARPSESIVASFYEVTVVSAPTPAALDCATHDASHGPGQALGGAVPLPCSQGFDVIAGTTFPAGYSCVECCQPVWKDGAPLQQPAAPARDLPLRASFVGQAPFTLIRR
jgi:hypothetical protein